MQVIEILNNNVEMNLPESVACIGYFDGLHKGHLALIQKTLDIAQQTHKKSALITFEPDPWTIIHGEETTHITTVEDRIEICSKLGFDLVFIIRFDKAFSQVEPHDFIAILYKNYNISHLVCGFDFRYGRFGKGNKDTLLNDQCERFSVTVIDQIVAENEKVSSSHIINLIEDGEMEKVRLFLTRNYQIRGVVVSGSQIGRKLGFPTANLSFSNEYVIPKVGLYFGYTLVDDHYYPSMINVGYNPTTNHLTHVSVESHLLDFNDDLYGQTIKLYFTHYYRSEQSLNSFEELIDLMKLDELAAREYFKENKNEMIG